MEAKIKARIEELKKFSQQKQQELQSIRSHAARIETDIIAISGAIQELEKLIVPNNSETKK